MRKSLRGRTDLSSSYEKEVSPIFDREAEEFRDGMMKPDLLNDFVEE